MGRRVYVVASCILGRIALKLEVRRETVANYRLIFGSAFFTARSRSVAPLVTRGGHDNQGSAARDANCGSAEAVIVLYDAPPAEPRRPRECVRRLIHVMDPGCGMQVSVGATCCMKMHGLGNGAPVRIRTIPRSPASKPTMTDINQAQLRGSHSWPGAFHLGPQDPGCP